MSAEKLNIQELAAGLAAKTGETKKDSELFWRELITIIQEALVTDELVKVKGLGTFKLQWNESRKSVNVNTGEEIEIAGFHKVVFTPDNEMKDIVNQPFAHLETVMLDDEDEHVSPAPKIDPLQNLSVQAIEIASLISDINVEVKTTEEVYIIEEPVEEKIIETNSIEESKEENVVENTDVTEQREIEKEVQKAELVENEVVFSEEKTDVEEEKPKKKRGCFWKILLIVLLLLFAGIVACYFLFPKSIYRDFIDQMILKKDQPALVDEATDAPEDEYAGYQPEQTLPALAFQFNPFDYEMSYFTAGEGTRLASFARKHYGSYIFWPYIFLANKDIMTYPDSLDAGTKIRIPKLPKEMVDINNPEAIERVSYIQARLDQY